MATHTTTPHMTEHGTPCSKSWDDDWIVEVEATEKELGRRCCGAHAPDDEPCILESNSANGRCRFHGGGKNVGAPKGNTNAVIHGLYSMRVQQCGSHCPMWNNCLKAGPDVMKAPQSKRPLCPYEVEELNAFRAIHEHVQPINKKGEQIRDRSHRSNHPFQAQLTMLRENLNLLQLMITRASKALNIKGLTTETLQQTDTYYASFEKPSAFLQAFNTLTREHRQTLNTYHRIVNNWGLDTREAT